MRFDRSQRSARGQGAGSTRGRSARRLSVAVTAAAASALVISACGGSSSGNSAANKSNVNYGTKIAGTLPTAGEPVKGGGGAISISQLTGETPTDIFPIVDGQSCSTQTANFISHFYIPLYYGPDGARPQIDYTQGAAEPPVYTNGDKTVTIKIKPGLKWSDGKPVTAQDLLFDYDLLDAGVKESPANYCQYSPGQLPDNVASVSTKGANTFVMNLKSKVNTNWFTTNQLQVTILGLYPIPSKDWNIAAAGGPHLDYTNPDNAKKIFDFLLKQGESPSTFGTNPLWKVVDGPFKLKDFSATNGSFDMVPNPTYGLEPKATLKQVSVNTYSGYPAVLNALKSGSLDVGRVDASSQLGAIPGLEKDGFSVFGTPSWGWYGGILNFKDTTNSFDKIIAQPYIKAVLAELENQPAWIKGIYHGYAVPAYGPVASAPFSSLSPKSAAETPYPYNPKKAAESLRSHGWNVKPGGLTTCAKPGTSATECGAGIPAGTKFEFTWANVPKGTAPAGVLQSQAFASEAEQAAGIKVDFVTKSFNFLTANYNNQNPAATKYTNDWAVNNFGGIGLDYNPTQTGVENPDSGLNMGDYNDPIANKLMHDSVTSSSADAVKAEVAYFIKNYPVLYGPDEDYIAAVSKRIGGNTNSFLVLGYQQDQPQFWYIKK
jgi:peptide/nickel transport system substrate-binding protein